jgi:NAD+ kinase
MKDKIYLVYDKTKNSLKIRSYILKKIQVISLKKANIIIVLGGDGFMLQTLKKLYRFNKPFYGVNSGNYGFLMNKFSNKNFIQNLKKSNNIKIYPLQMTVKSKNNQIKKSIAINEVSILRQSKQASSISIISNKKDIIKKLISDGVLVSTPAGSTAYNLSAHGPILSLDSNKLAVTPISPFRPRRWGGAIISDKSVINIKNLDVVKRPISAVADNFEVRNAKNVTIKVDKKISFNLLYNKNNSLYKKIKIEQARKETNNNKTNLK